MDNRNREILSEDSVQVCTTTVQSLFENGFEYMGEQLKIQIDNYQRDYVWSNEKVNQLIDDVESHEDQVHYYLGSLLFHRKKGGASGLYIIDGQQRLTTLAILYYLSRNEIPDHFELKYQSITSRKNIKQVQKSVNLENASELVTKMGRIDVTVTVTDSQDQAFNFFDSQNTRGVRLSATDLLKSYHLRDIGSENGLSEDAARRWEKLQSRDKVLIKNPQKDPAFELFERSLWRIRNWTRRNFEYEEWDTVLNEFEQNRNAGDSKEVTLFPGPKNCNYESLVFGENKEWMLKRTPISLGSKAKNLPVLIPQPLYDGYFFFLYAEKYSELMEELKDDEDDNIVLKFLSMKDGVSYYLKELLLNLALAYIDRFGKESENFKKFIELTMLWFLQNRLERQSFRKLSPFRMLRDQINLFGLIEVAYDSWDLLERFKKALVHQENADKEVEPDLRKIHNRYIDSMEKYLPENWDSLKEKTWKEIYNEFELKDE